jgi:hypothetical protein
VQEQLDKDKQELGGKNEGSKFGLTYESNITLGPNGLSVKRSVDYTAPSIGSGLSGFYNMFVESMENNLKRFHGSKKKAEEAHTS